MIRRKEPNIMKMICDKDYLILPASFHAKKKQLYFYLDGVMVYSLWTCADLPERRLMWSAPLKWS